MSFVELIPNSPRSELLQRAKELDWGPVSFVTSASTGFIFFTWEHKQEDYERAVKKGRTFLMILERDLEVSREEFEIGQVLWETKYSKGPRHYHPLKVLEIKGENGQRRMEDLTEKSKEIKGFLVKLEEDGDLGSEEAVRYLKLLDEFHHLYAQAAAEALTEYDFGPKVG